MEPLILYNLIFDVALCLICCAEFHRRNKQLKALTDRISELEADKRVRVVMGELKESDIVLARKSFISDNL